MADTDCVFCRIVAGEAEALVVDETPTTLAFSPLDPFAPGHVLVIPKPHHESLFDAPEDVLADVTARVQALAKRLRRDGSDDRGFDGVNVMVDNTGYQSVPHLHFHLVGRDDEDDDLFPETGYDGSKRDAYDAVTAALDSTPDRDR